MLIKFLLAVIFCELIVEVVVKSDLFEPITSYFKNRIDDNKLFWFIGSLLSCGYCFSVYVGIFTAVLFNMHLVGKFIFDCGYICGIIDIIVSGLIIHRCSNILHNLIDKYTNKFYDLRYRKSDDIIMEDINNG